VLRQDPDAEKDRWRFKSAAKHSAKYIIDDKSRPQPGVPKSSAENIGRLLRGALGRALISFRAAERRGLVAGVCGGSKPGTRGARTPIGKQSSAAKLRIVASGTPRCQVLPIMQPPAAPGR
jgi:hypothetical protein